MDPQLYVGAAGVPIVMALVQVAVKPFVKDKRVWPLATIVLSVAWNELIGTFLLETPPQDSLAIGLLAGLTALGLWSGGKNTVSGDGQAGR